MMDAQAGCCFAWATSGFRLLDSGASNSLWRDICVAASRALPLLEATRWDTLGTLFVWLRGGGLFASHDGASIWHPVETREALRRSGVEPGRGSLVADPRHPGRVYLGHA